MILKLEDQVAPLELCQRLRELGAPQDSLYLWNGDRITTWWREALDAEDPQLHTAAQVASNEAAARAAITDGKLCAAYTVAELGALLPDLIHADGGAYFLSAFRRCEVMYSRDGKLLHHVRADQEAEARAKLLIALVERGVVTFAKVAT